MTETTIPIRRAVAGELTILGETARAVVLGTGMDRDSCIFTTAVVCELLRRRNIAAEGLLVKVAAINEAFAVGVNRRGGWPQTKEDFEALGTDASCRLLGYSRAHGKTVADDKIDGHLVAIVQGQTLLDASLDQMDAPGDGIMAGTVCARVRQGFLVGARQEAVVLSQGLAIYEAIPADRSWAEDLDWRAGPIIRTVADAVERRLRYAAPLARPLRP